MTEVNDAGAGSSREMWLPTHKRKLEDDTGRSGLLNTLENSLGDIRELVNCRICVHPMYEPYTTDCGHTFCYGCLVKWFGQNRHKKSCPDCRAKISRQPAPSFAVSTPLCCEVTLQVLLILMSCSCVTSLMSLLLGQNYCQWVKPRRSTKNGKKTRGRSLNSIAPATVGCSREHSTTSLR